MVVLVTGGSGFVGTAVVADLIRRGHQVVATTAESSRTLPEASHLCWVKWNAMKEVLPPVDWGTVEVILHLATPRDLFVFPDQAQTNFELNIAATFRFLETARKQGVRRVLFASTGDVLGSGERLASENDVLYMPNSFYGTTKACAELLLASYLPLVSTATLRFYHPYGPGGDRFLINRLLNSVAQGREIELEGVEGIILNPVWIEDLALGVSLAVESNETGIFHLAGPTTVTLRQLLERIGMLLNRQPIIRTQPCTCVQRHAASFERSQQLLGYNPRISLDDGLRRLLKENYISSNSRRDT